MNYQQLFVCHNLLASIPFVEGERSMPAELVADVVLLQAAYQKAIDEFNGFMQSVLSKLKPESFDLKLQKKKRLEVLETALCSETGLTPEAEKEMSDLREELVGFDDEFRQVETAYSIAYSEKLKGDVDAPKMSRETYEHIVSFIGVSGEISAYNMKNEEIKVKKTEFVRSLGLLLLNG